jgi:predicted transcriptional regulator
MTKVTSVRLEDGLSDALDQLAVSMDRPRTWLIEQAIKRYIEEQSWQVGAIREALAEYRTGAAEITPHEQVMSKLKDKLKGRPGE